MKGCLYLISFALAALLFIYYGMINLDTHRMTLFGFVAAFYMFAIQREIKK
ncbi:hypothetical protein [Desemzia sp. FAM 23991]|uniref:hypothetical protein n=1 Tax=unclassified Desemzia TaxID=2685243 RepID=UPI0009D55F73|nr:Uncharacterised protein [Mycobacteroides abscessus subsp. abscessus]